MKCPMRNDAMGNMPECDPECAWLVKRSAEEGPKLSACAVTLLPSSHMRGLTKPANVKED